MAGSRHILRRRSRGTRRCRSAPERCEMRTALSRARPGVARVDDPVVVDPAGQDHRQGLGVDLLLDQRPACAVSAVLVEGLAWAPAPALATIDSTPASCWGPSPRTSPTGPGEQEPRVVRPPAHAVVAGAVGGAEQHRQVRHRQLVTALIIIAPCLMMPRLLVLLADHVAGRVVQEQQRGIGRLASWMNWVAFCDSSLNSTPRALARMPTGSRAAAPSRSPATGRTAA